MASVWVTAFRRVERKIGGPLEGLVQHDDVIAAMIRLSALEGGARRRVERVLRLHLHLLNLPALTDVRRLSQQLASVERSTRELSRAIEARSDAGAAPLRRTRDG